MKIPSYSEICKRGSGAGAFFASILVWGVGIGCFAAVFNNFLVEIHDVSGAQRGLLEFLRETPGVMHFPSCFAILFSSRGSAAHGTRTGPV